MIKRISQHVRTAEAETELQNLLENTEYYDNREKKAKEIKGTDQVFFCRLCDKEISKAKTLLDQHLTGKVM